MSDFYKWKNSFADVLSAKYGSIVLEFFTQVVDHSLNSLDTQISSWADNEYLGSAFIQGDLEELSRASSMAFCLSIQFLWERQIRTYITGSIKYTKMDHALEKKAMTCRWEEMSALFESIKNIPLTSFPSYPKLNLLHTLGNACRHGNGPSTLMLWKTNPELWPYRSQNHSLIQEKLSTQPSPSIELMVIPRTLLRDFVEAIVLFWEDVEYIYLESIESKDPSLTAKLIEIRNNRKNQKRSLTKP